MKLRSVVLGICVLIGGMLVTSASVHASGEVRASRPSRNVNSVTVPVDIGVGPAGVIIAGNTAEDQLLHYGVRISVAAIIDQTILRRYRRQIPPAYRNQLLHVKQLRFRPSELTFLPKSLIISPKLNNTGVYGATWGLVGLGLAPVSEPIRIGIDGSIIASYLYLHSERLPGPTHFIRPGIELKADIEVGITQDFLMSLGWASQFYIPQELGESPWQFADLKGGDVENTLWHIGQIYLMFHYRFPYTTNL